MKKLLSPGKVATFVALWIGWSQYAVAEIVLSAGARMQDSSELANNAVAGEIAVSAPFYGPLRHNLSIDAIARSESGYAENRFGYYLGYRHSLTDRVFVEPQAGLVYLQHSRQQGQASSMSTPSAWDRTSAHARAFGIVAGYRAGPRSEVTMSIRRYLADIEVKQQATSSSCTGSCDGIDDVVDNPYAGLELPWSVEDLSNRTIISLSAGVRF
ncbi:MAG: hypothetical protein V2I38_14735 [Alcanivoracaceae bacterium]|jgi:hypothetical protein|nr:hypothetical protein [Alcanivoracaceae bacterium]